MKALEVTTTAKLVRPPSDIVKLAQPDFLTAQTQVEDQIPQRSRVSSGS